MSNYLATLKMRKIIKWYVSFCVEYTKETWHRGSTGNIGAGVCGFGSTRDRDNCRCSGGTRIVCDKRAGLFRSCSEEGWVRRGGLGGVGGSPWSEGWVRGVGGPSGPSFNCAGTTLLCRLIPSCLLLFSVCVCVCVRACVCACVRACVRVIVCTRAHALSDALFG